jgi:FKBP-type peptidyl-prolyl cis-trans isomerase
MLFNKSLFEMNVRVTKDGVGKRVPKGATVFIHYTGKTMNGRVIDRT